MDLLATTALRLRLAELQVELNKIEQAMTDAGSSQGTLDEVWTNVTREMDELVEILAIDEMNTMECADTLVEMAQTGYCGFECNFGCPTCSEQYDPRDEI